MSHDESMSNETSFRRSSGASPDEQSMAQIREILFGEHSRQTASQIAGIETQLGEQQQALRHLLDERLESAMAALRADLDKQATRQQAALDGLDNALRALLARADERLTLLDSDLQDSQHAVRQTLDQQAMAIEQLEQRHIGRTELASLLETVARQLREPDA